MEVCCITKKPLANYLSKLGCFVRTIIQQKIRFTENKAGHYSNTISILLGKYGYILLKISATV